MEVEDSLDRALVNFCWDPDENEPQRQAHQRRAENRQGIEKIQNFGHRGGACSQPACKNLENFITNILVSRVSFKFDSGLSLIQSGSVVDRKKA
jgi:hypothetical protein